MKYLFVAALTMGFSATVMAQDGSKADVDAVKKIISSKPADLDKQMKPFYKANKKNAENLVAFCRAFYEAKDTANARVYANYALTASKNNCAPAFIILGDIAVMSDEGGIAAQQYEQAINVDPKNPDAYYKYALVYRKVDPRGVAQKMDQLKALRPDIQTDAIMGHMYTIQNKDAEAYEFFSKVPMEKMNKGYLSEFARSCFFSGHHADGVRACDFAVQQFPRNATFNRLGMMCCVEAKQYEKALQYADRFFNASDSIEKFYNHEYFYPALAYKALKQHDKAIEHFHKALSLKGEGNLASEESILSELSNAYQAKGDFDNAAKYLKSVHDKKEKLQIKDYETLANLYIEQGDSAKDEAAKEQAYMKADAIYADLEGKFADNKAYFLYRRASIGNKIDPELAKGTAKPHYEALIELLEPKTDKDASDNQILLIAYYYKMSFSLHKENDVAKAKDFAAKILAINPEHKQAKAVSELK